GWAFGKGWEDGCGEASEGRGGGKTGCSRELLGAFSAAAGPVLCMDPRLRDLGLVEQSLWDLHPPHDARSPQSHQGSWDRVDPDRYELERPRAQRTRPVCMGDARRRRAISQGVSAQDLRDGGWHASLGCRSADSARSRSRHVQCAPGWLGGLDELSARPCQALQWRYADLWVLERAKPG